MKSLAIFVVAAALSACSSSSELYCDETTPCTAGHPVCDLEGVCPLSSGVGNTCIPEACWDAGAPAVDAGLIDALSVADASVPPDAPEEIIDAVPPDAPPLLKYDIVAGSELETNVPVSGSGLVTSGFLVVVNTGDVAFDLANLNLTSTSGSGPAGTQTVFSCGPVNAGTMLQPGDAAGYVASGVAPHVNPLVTETNAYPDLNLCQIELKFFSASGWVAYGMTGNTRIAVGVNAGFNVGFVEKPAGGLVSWTDAARQSSQ